MSKIAWSIAVGAVFSIAGLALAGSAAPSAAVQASCVKVFERQRTCTASFIPALVDLRASLDLATAKLLRRQLEGLRREGLTVERLGSIADSERFVAQLRGL